MSYRRALILLSAVFLYAYVSFSKAADIDTYGLLPAVRSVSISPDGKHIAYIKRIDNIDYFVVLESDTMGVITLIPTNEYKARSTSFVTNNHVLVQLSKTTRIRGYHGRNEISGAWAYSINKNEHKLLFKGSGNVHPAQTGLGEVVGLNSDEEALYMPALANYKPYPLNLYKVNLNTGKAELVAAGSKHTIGWFVGDDGNVLATEAYAQDSKIYSISSRISGEWKRIHASKASGPLLPHKAISSDGKSLVFKGSKDNRDAIFSMSLVDGTVEGPLFSKPNTDIDFLDTDINRRLTAVVYGGYKTTYEFTDELDNQLFKSLSAAFPMSSIEYRSSTRDKKKLVIKVSGADAAGAYMIFDTEELHLERFAVEYDVDAIGELEVVRYKARDGLDISAIITYPFSSHGRENLPLIVLPHGGPEDYDKLGFNWLAQYFSSKGYLVLQPNFRGSTGFGYEFRNAGRGRWGQEMQDDVTDGVSALVQSGHADPQRVCIIGASYGGYSALAGGAFSPDVYKCIVSINGVSDLPLMMKNDRKKYGAKHWVVSYWKKIIADSKTQKEKLKMISPVNFAEAFQAPVLLIHGKDDKIVSIRQSEKMQWALERERKQAKLLKLKGEDHWLSTSENRLQTLKAIDEFLDKHNPIQIDKGYASP